MAMGVDEGKQAAGGGISIGLLVLIIAAVVAFVILGLGFFTRSQNRISETVGSLDAAQFSAYDNKTITGDQVMSAVRTYIGQNIVLVIDNKNSDIEFFTAGTGDTLPVVIDGTSYGQAAPYNVGLMAKASAEGGDSGQAQLVYNMNDGHIYTGAAPTGDTNIMMSTDRNTNIRPLVTKVIGTDASALYVESGATYYSVLLYEPSTRTVNGIAFVRSTDN